MKPHTKNIKDVKSVIKGISEVKPRGGIVPELIPHARIEEDKPKARIIPEERPRGKISAE